VSDKRSFSRQISLPVLVRKTMAYRDSSSGQTQRTAQNMDGVSHSIAGGTLVLNISTTNGTQLHTQTWGVSITVPHNEMGQALELPAPVSWDGPSSDLGGEVVLFSLALVGKAEVLSRQLYTFGILKAGTSAQDNMTAVQPMRPLLEAPAAQCTLSAPTCKQGNSAATTICKSQISNTGSTPCLYMELSLSDPSVPGESPCTRKAEASLLALPRVVQQLLTPCMIMSMCRWHMQPRCRSFTQHLSTTTSSLLARVKCSL